MKKRYAIVPLLAAGLLLILFPFSHNAEAAKSKAATIPEGVYIGEVSVGGMTEEEATEAVTDYVDSLGSSKVVLIAGDNKARVSAEDLGVSFTDEHVIDSALHYGSRGNLISRYKDTKNLEKEDQVLALPVSIDKEKAEAALDAVLDDLNTEAVDYGLEHDGDTFTVTGGTEGVEVVQEDSLEAISDSLACGWEKGKKIELVTEVDKPQGSPEELATVKDVLGEFSTDYSGSVDNRKTNVANGTDKIDGTVLYPGETFSVYNAVSPFDEENGYAEAASYENGATVKTYGGGICQVSTTLYNAVIRAELDVTERFGHSMLVSYVDPSADAAIASEMKDLKFTNNLEDPVYIEGSANGFNVKFTIYGKETRPANREVSFESETVSTTDPTEAEFKATNDPIGTFTLQSSAHKGTVAQLWKVVTVDGEEESRELFNSTEYAMTPTVYLVGTGSNTPSATAAMNAAIATQDLTTVQNAVMAYASYGYGYTSGQ